LAIINDEETALDTIQSTFTDVVSIRALTVRLTVFKFLAPVLGNFKERANLYCHALRTWFGEPGTGPG
jgi:hypothetical protein